VAVVDDDGAAAQRIYALLPEELVGSGFGWTVGKDGVPGYVCQWETPANGLGFRVHVDRLTPEVDAWHRGRGWIASGFDADVIVAPSVEIEPPAVCWHTTPAPNTDGIQRFGLHQVRRPVAQRTDRADRPS
jgi:hypothetical protein